MTTAEQSTKISFDDGAIRLQMPQVVRCTWEDYVAVADRLQKAGRVRICFDDGWMEFIVPTLKHEVLNGLVAQLIQIAARVFLLAYRRGGATTFRKPREAAAEPDSCFWIAHAERMRGRADFDPSVDPPPDLVVEVDVAATSEHRMAVWTALGVPEVWRVFADGSVRFCQLIGGRYEATPTSLSYPSLRAEQLTTFVAQDANRLNSEIAADFRAFLTQQP